MRSLPLFTDEGLGSGQGVSSAKLARGSRRTNRQPPKALLVSLLGCGVGLAVVGCDSCQSTPTQTQAAPSATAQKLELTPEQAQRVLAKVGERSITLGEYVAALERMDHFERLRYQTPERRRQLLDEMINVELLAREAERRGLDKLPETQAHLRQLQREQVITELREQQPSLDELPESEVRAYYESHPDEFSDPERRRVAVIVSPSSAQAQKNLQAVRGQDAKTWGRVAREQIAQRGPRGQVPLEFEGDLGLVSAPGQERGQNEKVPEPVRAAVFKLSSQGEVAPEVIEHEGNFYVVRLMGVNPPRKRKISEVDNVIRVRLLQARLKQAEQKLDERLRKEIPIEIDQAAVKQLQLPPGVSDGDASDKTQKGQSEPQK